jgi:hypothetical protein
MTTESFTMIESHQANKRGPIRIKPYFDANRPNMGLEQYGLVLFDGVAQEEQLACLERNGIKQYLTGLNEFAPEIKLLPKELRDAKIKDIRTTVAQLEKELAANVLDPEDPNFWQKVVLLKPNNDEFWGKISLRCTNDDLVLDPAKDPYDLIKIYAIEANGFSMVAKSYEDAKSRPVPTKFYLDKYEDTASTKTEVKKLRNKALAELQKLFDKNQNKLFYVAKVLDSNSVQYKKSTPNDVTYDNMDKYINGEGIETNKKRAAQSFLDACAMDMETLKIKSIIKDSSFYKYIAIKVDGFIYHQETSTLLGRNPSDVAEYLRNPLNETILIDLTKKVEKLWNS